VAICHGGELSEWRVVRVASCHGGELKGGELKGGELYGQPTEILSCHSSG
jgi:hypothetical protein